MPPLWLGYFAVALVCLSAVDLKVRKLPNSLVALLFVAGVARASLDGLSEVLFALLGALIGGALLLWQFSRNWVGAGDVKLLAAVGAWVGPLGVLWVFIFGSAIGGVLSILAFVQIDVAEREQIRRNMLMLRSSQGASIPETGALSRHRGIPYGVALSAAAVGVALYGGAWS